MEGTPFCVGGVVNLQNGDNVKNYQITGLPIDKIFFVEFVGINAFAQSDQILFVSIEVTTGGRPGVYPIVLMGSSPYWDPTYPKRVFGSQQVNLYADPNTNITIAVARNNTNKDSRVIIELTGRIL
jgi:hypothetical protein